MTSRPAPAPTSPAGADCASAGDAPAPPANPSVSVIVVNYNTGAMTLDCLRALYASLDGIHAEVLLADNGSTDGSVDAIREQFPQVLVTANDRNHGFGAANNQLMELARGDYFLLLNSDAFVEPGTVRALIEYLQQNPHVAVVGPRLVNADGSVQNSCFPFPSPLRAWLENLWIAKLFPHGSPLGDYRGWQHDREKLVPWIIGACMLVRSSVYRQVGGFDERFFMYAEETDWERLMRDAGWEIAFTPATRVKHLGGASGTSEKPRINEQFFRSLDLYEIKHHGTLGLVLLRIAMVIGALLRIPPWLAVWLLLPRRRDTARARLRVLLWLLRRQVLQPPPSNSFYSHG